MPSLARLPRPPIVDLLELAGLALVAYGAGLAWLPAGFIVGGLLLTGYGVIVELAAAKKRPPG